MTVTITDGDFSYSIGCSKSAMQRARVSFNPSGNRRVNALKMLTAALYSECEAIMSEADGLDPDKAQAAKREAATAMTQLQSGAMFAVSAATAGL